MKFLAKVWAQLKLHATQTHLGMLQNGKRHDITPLFTTPV